MERTELAGTADAERNLLRAHVRANVLGRRRALLDDTKNYYDEIGSSPGLDGSIAVRVGARLRT